MITRRSAIRWVSITLGLGAAAPIAARAATTTDDMAALAKAQTDRYNRLPPIDKYEAVIGDLKAMAEGFDDQAEWNLGYAITYTAFEAIACDLRAIPRPTRPHMMIVDPDTTNLLVIGLPEGFDLLKVLETVKAAPKRND